MILGLSVSALHQTFLLLREEKVQVDFGALLTQSRGDAWHELTAQLREQGSWRKLRLLCETCGVKATDDVFIQPVTKKAAPFLRTLSDVFV